MKLQNLLVSTLTGYLLVGAWGEVAAQIVLRDVDCSQLNGTISDVSVDSINIEPNESCVVINTAVRNRITANGADAVVLSNVLVGVRIRIEDTNAIAILDSEVFGGNVVVNNSGLVTIRSVVASSGDIRLRRNRDVNLSTSQAINLRCNRNTNQAAAFNRAFNLDSCTNIVEP